MKTGLYEINGEDAYTRYGVVLDYDSLGSLLAPPPMKDVIENDSPLSDGVELGDMPKVAKRNITLIFHLYASSAAQAQQHYESFVSMLLSAPFKLKVMRTGITYNLRYKSSTGFVPWYYSHAKFTLSVTEPDPTNHS